MAGGPKHKHRRGAHRHEKHSRRWSPYGECDVTGKVCYLRDDALRLAQDERRAGDRNMSAYRCAGCGWWHIGHLQ